MDSGKIFSNTLIPKYVPNNLKWNKRDGLDTWYLQGKSNDFIENIDLHFANINIVNFDMISNDLRKETIKKYKTFKIESINEYPQAIQGEIKELLCRNINRDNFHVSRQNVVALLQEQNNSKKRVARGRGRFLKICRDSMYASCW